MCQQVGERDGGKVVTRIESIVVNSCHRAGEDDGGQTVTLIESTVSYARHSIGNVTVEGIVIAPV